MENSFTRVRGNAKPLSSLNKANWSQRKFCIYEEYKERPTAYLDASNFK